MESGFLPAKGAKQGRKRRNANSADVRELFAGNFWIGRRFPVHLADFQMVKRS
jgi:hypothetical protein